MDLDEALRRRLEENLNGSGWGVLEFHPDPSAVRFWLYSVNLVSGRGQAEIRGKFTHFAHNIMFFIAFLFFRKLGFRTWG
ncbi:MAG: hypothetical protein U1B30_16105 [Pseudomonadota bacterium]|jgi:hypothetical protein|nr:hypothetical protein [Pseudomonadota bacterium]